ncbi:MbcA/ParS/Xre antitoxin family protein [Defluviimonas salinarum]|uniref:MbcA/ParS/Xre antitoxin family protein n=1 Tax=Defluviimonas salinarum TaxID=2992147 RepID=A0ABT3J6C7_9RHOB|nr:MbcA/ParS/Xre antitoxin family protein [Defluviimonas salinarum]MCW3783221.1 MbcA/ParS/Xre antitoxin family protein [Defluviimonas salinarum]
MTQPGPGSAAAAGANGIPAAMEAFSRLSDMWGLSTDEQITLLGSPGRSTFFKWRKSGGNLPNDTIERISHLLSIYKALQILLPNPNAADSWVKKENKFFDGQSALDVMLGGQVADIYKVREYVNAQRGG